MREREKETNCLFEHFVIMLRKPAFLSNIPPTPTVGHLAACEQVVPTQILFEQECMPLCLSVLSKEARVRVCM